MVENLKKTPRSDKNSRSAIVTSIKIYQIPLQFRGRAGASRVGSGVVTIKSNNVTQLSYYMYHNILLICELCTTVVKSRIE